MIGNVATALSSAYTLGSHAVTAANNLSAARTVAGTLVAGLLKGLAQDTPPAPPELRYAAFDYTSILPKYFKKVMGAGAEEELLSMNYEEEGRNCPILTMEKVDRVIQQGDYLENKLGTEIYKGLALKVAQKDRKNELSQKERQRAIFLEGMRIVKKIESEAFGPKYQQYVRQEVLSDAACDPSGGTLINFNLEMIRSTLERQLTNFKDLQEEMEYEYQSLDPPEYRDKMVQTLYEGGFVADETLKYDSNIIAHPSFTDFTPDELAEKKTDLQFNRFKDILWSSRYMMLVGLFIMLLLVVIL